MPTRPTLTNETSFGHTTPNLEYGSHQLYRQAPMLYVAVVTPLHAS